MNKVIYVVLDGLGDDPLPQLKDRTPLEAAPTPFLDALAARGINGVVTTVGQGIAPESDIAVFAVLGYDPRVHHAGRGPMEGLGAGMDIRDGDLVYRINFATVDGDGRTIVDRRVGRNLTSEEARALAASANAGVRLPGASAELVATVAHRGVLLIRRDEPLSAEVTNTDPAYERIGALGVAKLTFDDVVQTCEPLPGNEQDERARTAADLTNEYLSQVFRVLDADEVNARRRSVGSMPGNIILTRDGGDHLPTPPSFKEHFGADWGCFVEMPVERGISMVLGMGQVEVPMAEAVGGVEAQYRAWAETALEAIEGYDGLYIHIKGPDIPAHDGDHEAKTENIAAIDEHFFGTLIPELRADALVAVTADHSTSCAKKAHTDDPVPLVVAGPGVAADAVNAFGERAARKGGIGHVQGIEIMPRLMGLARG